jgi:hypothetical protein
MTFNIFVTQRVSCFGQDDRIHDLISPDLRGDKRAVFRQLLVDEFHFPAVFECFYPLLVWHVRKDPFKKSVSIYHGVTLNSPARHLDRRFKKPFPEFGTLSGEPIEGSDPDARLHNALFKV